MNVISVREQPAYKDMAIAYFQKNWKGVLPVIYEDCINHSIEASAPLPQWYLLMNEDKIIGCAGLITNDFISRMDLYPWVCALFIEEQHRGNSYGSILLEQVKKDSAKAGFQSLYLCTDHIGYYEKYGFNYLAQGYHPWGEKSRIYQAQL
ncbi:GNAT family N-acetyltransferase [Sunxiuqinia elliptica]|uniref:Acetyltransferase (GNAT) domain-containing protein n=1 Tax=Sunxiuqinia elliptica TaxID=655355 RepID=A0A1I2JFN6_9BACT|nr:GNAT family N-acetyltransferase [Sunxiuqinia elliptica]SFF52800.1 Acetyltransferase (GNAT) domain-containing protein [Sunxiuqinia elliptica]